ncbi:MAG TPA: hypothetical protein DCS67_09090 [Clostridiales bacterium UBA8960]|jgi:DNA-binding CsgD family transcriptional regulator|nr:hypothetical protein [Clostridiales bacterium UBA8960]
MDKWIHEHYHELFEPGELEKLHKALLNVSLDDLNEFSRLISAWVAFVYGDNALLSKIMRSIDRSRLSAAREFSLYDSLYALCGDIYAVTPDMKLNLAIDAVRVMQDQSSSVIYGNARLTLGQVHSERNEYNEAVKQFSEAKTIFERAECVFLTIIADVNRLLNLYKQGAYKMVIEESERAVRQISSFNGPSETQNALYKIYDLPIGMSLIELGKYELALTHLDACKSSIDALKMFHLHGLIEWSRFKAMRLRGDYMKLREALEDYRRTFSGLTSPFLKGIEDFNDVMMALEEKSDVDGTALERLMHLLEHHKKSLNFILVEMMVCLQLKGVASFYKSQDIEWLDARVTEYGIVPIMQLVKRVRDTLTYDLSDRELEILALLSEGESNDQIGKRLFISTGTVKWHLGNIYSKLDVKNRVKAIEKYRALIG